MAVGARIANSREGQDGPGTTGPDGSPGAPSPLGREETMSIRKATQKKRSSADIKRAIEQIETEIATERKRREKSGETFTASCS